MASSISTSETSPESIERLFKTFTFRCLQVIVHSRVEVSSIPSSREYTESFNLFIPENAAIEDSLKKSLKDVKSFPPKGPICVEVALVTNEGDHMFLETWDLSFNRSSLDVTAYKTQHMFTRMGVTLKSLISATRVLPAYKLARNQGEKGGGYTLTHRVYTGKPQTHMLGDGFKTVRAGAIPTAVGLLTASVSYRTKLLLSTEMPVSARAAIEVKENYFMKEAEARNDQGSPKMSNPVPCSSPIKSPTTRSESPYCFAVSPSSLEIDDKAMRVRAEELPVWAKSSVLEIDELPEPVFGAFSRQQPMQRRSAEPEVPFEGLMRKSVLQRQEQRLSGEQMQQGVAKNMAAKEQGEEKENIPSKPTTKNVFDIRQANIEEEFVMIDKPPFAEEDDPGDVKAFLSAMMRAPKLFDNPNEINNETEAFGLAGKTGNPQPTVSVGQYLSDVEELVNRLEEEMPDLDEFCNSVINMDSREEEDEDGAGFLFS